MLHFFPRLPVLSRNSLTDVSRVSRQHLLGCSRPHTMLICCLSMLPQVPVVLDKQCVLIEQPAQNYVDDRGDQRQPTNISHVNLKQKFL